MSDDDDTPVADTTPGPDDGKGWSEQDRRTLIITVAGGLAVNLGTVILVGLAIALVHSSRTHAIRLLVSTLMLVLGGLAFVAIGVYHKRLAGQQMTWPWGMIALGWLVVAIAVLMLTGLAAGVK